MHKREQKAEAAGDGMRLGSWPACPVVCQEGVVHSPSSVQTLVGLAFAVMKGLSAKSKAMSPS